MRNQKFLSLLKKLEGSSPPVQEVQLISPDQIASRIVSGSRASCDKLHTQELKKKFNILCQILSHNTESSCGYIIEETKRALRDVKSGKGNSFDGKHRDFLLECG